MSSTLALDHPNGAMRALPQYGFGAVVDFDTLIKTNRFLFRVYTPKERSPFFDDTDPFFIAPRFDEKYNQSSEPLPDWNSLDLHSCRSSEVITHMDWTTRSSSPFISTSFSFMWSIWEALRRYHSGVKKDVQIAIIDATTIRGRAVTAVQELKRCSTKERRRREYWGWYRFAQESQLVLVYGAIPGTAVLASVPLLSILKKMPSYFLERDAETIKYNPLSHIAWNYTEKKPSYRRFCQDMSNRFFGFPSSVRLRDTTSGSVRLAVSFLRPWLRQKIANEFETATSVVCILALTIAQWPSQWWAHDHAELWDIIRGMTLTLAEELREKISLQDDMDISQLHDIIDGLESIIKTYQTKVSPELSDDDQQWRILPDDISSDDSFQPSENPPGVCRPPFSTSMSLPDICAAHKGFEIPLTPPASPRNSLSIPSSYFGQYMPSSFSLPSSPAELISGDHSIHDIPDIIHQASKVAQDTYLHPSSPVQIPMPLQVALPPSPVQDSVEEPKFADQAVTPSAGVYLPIVEEVALATPMATPKEMTPFVSPGNISVPLQMDIPEEILVSMFSSALDTLSCRSESPPPSPSESSNDTTSPSFPPVTNSQTPTLMDEDKYIATGQSENTPTFPSILSTSRTFPFLIPPRETSGFLSPFTNDELDVDSEEKEKTQFAPTVAEAASCILTGFLVGAFITLCLMSPHRRALLYAT